VELSSAEGLEYADLKEGDGRRRLDLAARSSFTFTQLSRVILVRPLEHMRPLRLSSPMEKWPGLRCSTQVRHSLTPPSSRSKAFKGSRVVRFDGH